jgi:hypothetical protein
MGKVNIIRKMKSNPQFSKVKMYHLVTFVAGKVTQKQHVELRQKPWPLLRKKLSTEVLSEEGTMPYASCYS